MAVGFSGGLDSTVVAATAKRHADVVACSAYVPGAADASRSRMGAEVLGVPLRTVILDREGVLAEARRVRLPFEPSPMDVSLWCLYSMVARAALEAGSRVILLGQLADELFGGYAKYERTLESEGEGRAREMMDRDVEAFAARGRVRDSAACGQFVEARFPFEEAGVVAFGMSLPVGFRIRGGVRKAVLRRAAEILGVPAELAGMPKKAAQYSSGVQKLLGTSRF